MTLSTILLAGLLAASSPAAVGEDATEDPRAHGERVALRMIAAVGGMERWESLRDGTFVLRTTVFDLGPRPYVTDQKFSITKDPRPMVRVDIKQGRSVHTKVFDGRDSWLAINDQLRARKPGTMQRIRDNAKSAYFWFNFPFILLDPTVVVEHLGRVRQSEGELEVLQVSFRDGTIPVNAEDIHRFYVQPGTYLVMREEYYIQGRKDQRMEFLWKDYRGVDGVLKDHVREIVSTEREHVFQRMEVMELELGVGVPPDRFQPPGSPSSALRQE